MANKDSDELIRHIISVQGLKDAMYLLETVYPETDPLLAGGDVIWVDWDPEGDYEVILTANDPLSCMWGSSSDNLWIGSANGNIWTSAAVTWPPHRAKGLKYHVYTTHRTWNVTTLPNMKALGFRPNVISIWGTDDSDVYASTFAGTIYHWDGIAWQEMNTGGKSCLNALDGTGKDDVYCVGFDSTILHGDGSRWSRIPCPAGVALDEIFTGVKALGPDNVYVCSRGGTILHGGAQGFSLVGKYPGSFFGIAPFEDRILLAGGETGVWELKGNQASVIKDNVYAVGVFEAAQLLYFVEDEQEPSPFITEYNPADPDPWATMEF